MLQKEEEDTFVHENKIHEKIFIPNLKAQKAQIKRVTYKIGSHISCRCLPVSTYMFRKESNLKFIHNSSKII